MQRKKLAKFKIVTRGGGDGYLQKSDSWDLMLK